MSIIYNKSQEHEIWAVADLGAQSTLCYLLSILLLFVSYSVPSPQCPSPQCPVYFPSVYFLFLAVSLGMAIVPVNSQILSNSPAKTHTLRIILSIVGEFSIIN